MWPAALPGWGKRIVVFVFIIDKVFKKVLGCITNGVNLFKKKRSNPSCTLSTSHTEFQVMEWHFVYWHKIFCRPVPVGLRVYLYTELKLSLVPKQKDCGVCSPIMQYVKVPFIKTHFCFTVCFLDFVVVLHGWNMAVLQQFVLLTQTCLFDYLYCCTVHLVDSLNITQPTNALIVCHLF